MELTIHQRGIILRGIAGGASLRGKEPKIPQCNTVITCNSRLSLIEISCISCDAEAFGMAADFGGYDGSTKITFTAKA